MEEKLAVDRVEREVHIEAPIDVVWTVVTEPEHLRQWFADDIELELRPGGVGSLSFDSRATHRPLKVTLEVQSVEPPHRLVYRWAFPFGEERRASMLVEFSLAEDAGGTRLRVVESGIDAMPWTDGEKDRYAEDHAGGWDRHLGNVRGYAARVARG